MRYKNFQLVAQHEQICCISSCEFVKNEQTQNCCSKQTSTLFFTTTFFNLHQTFLLRHKLITPGEKHETWPKTCNKIMLRDKLRVFVSHISPPLGGKSQILVSLRVCWTKCCYFRCQGVFQGALKEIKNVNICFKVASFRGLMNQLKLSPYWSTCTVGIYLNFSNEHPYPIPWEQPLGRVKKI